MLAAVMLIFLLTESIELLPDTHITSVIFLKPDDEVEIMRSQ